ncbi:MAG TPA: ion channel [Mycobacterium sp.]|uniref:potassium channel family protein n=1 Tax=Mycolicibacterium sp. TaxID=2320850 RepID=UPI0025EC7367|nr:potassium channel family protein [Mycolicibacterium sp.]HPX37694.1 ion channel [Mycobacterium sp.]HQC76543.1 ion channel [Mycobacterium sp.]
MTMLQTRLQRWESKAEWALAGCAAVFLVLYTVEVLAEPQGRTLTVVSWALTLLYLPFVLDYLVRLYLAEKRFQWFIRHPLDLAVVTLPFLQPLRFLRLVALVRILQRAFGDAIRGRVIAFTAFGALLLAYVAALAELKAERYAPGAQITNFGDAVWWAITTLSTVGYGDFVPVTSTGRIIASLLMIGGISLIGVVTATVATWIVRELAYEEDVKEAATAEHIELLKSEILRLEAMVMHRDNGQPT